MTLDAETSLSLLREAMSEVDLMQSIIEAARRLGWWVYHPYRSTKSQPGWPDLFCLKDGRVLAYECKREKGRIRPEQLECLALLQAAGIPARIVRPSDFDSVLAELQEDV